jgi:hypothetical protein
LVPHSPLEQIAKDTDMRQPQGTHSEKHARKMEKVNADDVQIKFAPEVVRSLARLEAFVHDSEHYDSGLLDTLREMAAGRPVYVQSALTEMALITSETMKHVQATGDKRAEDALFEFHSSLMADPASKTCSVLVSKSRGR